MDTANYTKITKMMTKHQLWFSKKHSLEYFQEDQYMLEVIAVFATLTFLNIATPAAFTESENFGQASQSVSNMSDSVSDAISDTTTENKKSEP